MKKFRKIAAYCLLAFWVVCITDVIVWTGCVTIQPGSEPFVVRVEQSQLVASGSIDFILHLDNADRGFWKTNAPALHQFCEWLRTPLPYATTATVSRAQLIQLNVQDLKVAYKTNRTATASNTLWVAWNVLDTAVQQSRSWSNIVTRPIHP